ncbi:hypothetical protein NHF46_07370 [Arthrobacter alpinus]|nr:hypothetical protein [Arthrobacter alpinus]
MSDNSSEFINETILAGLDPNIVRMFKKDDAGALVFREAWVDAGEAKTTKRPKRMK